MNRRDFLKRVLALSAIASFVDVDLLRNNLDKFSNEQLDSLKEIETIKPSIVGPYCLRPRHTRDNKYYDIQLKDGQRLWLSDIQIKERYGDILDYLLESKSVLLIHSANWND